MAPSSKNPKSSKGPSGQKKEKVFHPQSRKAGQLFRTHIRKTKLEDLAKKRSLKQSSQVDVFSFFYEALPPEGELTLEELHFIVRDVWLMRHDRELEVERAARRKGRPKSTKEQKLEEVKVREMDAYRTGFEIPDLTHELNVKLFRKWDKKQVGYMQLLRLIRISSVDPQHIVLSHPGTHPLLIQATSDSSPPMDTSVSLSSDPTPSNTMETADEYKMVL